jgi:hypothetical protein
MTNEEKKRLLQRLKDVRNTSCSLQHVCTTAKVDFISTNDFLESLSKLYWNLECEEGEDKIIAALEKHLQPTPDPIEAIRAQRVAEQSAPRSLWQLLRDTWKGGSVLPKSSADRKLFPVWSGHDAYFPAAVVAVAGWSKAANEKHNPGQPLQHARGKSADHQDCQRRHALDSADPTCDKLEELTCKAWRAYAELQEYAETLGAPPAPAATFPETK